MATEGLHAAMLLPAFYPQEEGPVRFVETHVSRLYFTRRHVYKVKKPVDFGFLDFTTLDRRRFYCEEEVRLNRRFAPGVYLGVMEIRCRNGGFTLGGTGEIVEYAVRMERLPEDRMLDHLIAEKDPHLPKEMVRIGHRLGELHRESDPCPGENGRSHLDMIRFNWQENFEQTLPFGGRTLDRRATELCRTWVERFLEEHGPLLRRRETEGWVRDGHGDLHAEHICLTDPAIIYDCIEFNRRFRVGDIVSDLAFLLMDLDFRRRRDLAPPLLSAYAEALGNDPDREILLPFYKLYRAWVRGKVESFLSADASAPAQTREAAAERARRYFTLALGYLCPSPLLVLTCGLMGTGKSTVARGLAEAMGAAVLRSDALRKELAGEQSARGGEASFGEGIYDAGFTRRTYDRLLEAALEHGVRGDSVIVDASFGDASERARFMKEARRRGMIPVVLHMTCDRDTCLERLDRRQAAGEDISDGRRELFDLQARNFSPPGAEAIRVDTSHPVDYTVHFALVEILSSLNHAPDHAPESRACR